MVRPSDRLCFCLGTVFLLQSCTGAPSADAGTPNINVVSCAEPVGGIPLSETVLESALGYDEALAQIDLEQLPDELSLADLPLDQQAAIAYALGVRRSTLGGVLNRQDTLARGEMGRAILSAWAINGVAGLSGIDFGFFRRGFHRFYACDRGLPATLADFENRYGRIADLPLTQIEFSIPKGVPRSLREDFDRHIYVAQTEVGGEMESGTEIRETEIILGDHRDDGALEFLVYDSDGKLMDRSEFATITGGEVVSASPYACMSCHVDFEERTYDVIFPTGF